jgi:hypothetical protein
MEKDNRKLKSISDTNTLDYIRFYLSQKTIYAQSMINLRLYYSKLLDARNPEATDLVREYARSLGNAEMKQ